MQLLVTRLFCNALAKMIANNGVNPEEYSRLSFVDQNGIYYKMTGIKFDLGILYERGKHPMFDEALDVGNFTIKLEKIVPSESGEPCRPIWVDPMLRSIDESLPGGQMHIVSVESPVWFLEANDLFGVKIGDEVVMAGDWPGDGLKSGTVDRFSTDGIYVEGDEGEFWLMNNADTPMWRILDFRAPWERTLKYKAGDVVDVAMFNEVYRGMEIVRVDLALHEHGVDAMIYQVRKPGSSSTSWAAHDAGWNKLRFILGHSKTGNAADFTAKYKVGDRVYFKDNEGKIVTGKVISNCVPEGPRYRVESDLHDIWRLGDVPDGEKLYIIGLEAEIHKDAAETKFSLVMDEDLTIEIGKIFNVMHFTIADGKLQNAKREQMVFNANTAQRLTSIIEETLYSRE